MTTEPTPIAFDTGPLLCFGHIGGGVRLIRNRYARRMHWTEAVKDEIQIHAGRPPHSRYNQELAKAASPWVGRDRTALTGPHHIEDRAEVEKMRQRVRTVSGKQGSGNSDLGESETLVFAQEHPSAMLVNENAARKVAAGLGIQANCALDVLISEYLEGRLEYVKLRSMWEQIRGSTAIDCGSNFPSDRGALKRWRWRAPQ